MSKTQHILSEFLIVLLFLFFNHSFGNVGDAAFYSPPYLPTVCYGNDASQIPAFGMFVAAGEGVWDNGASCGRQYEVRCLSSKMPKACILDQTIQVKVVDRASMLNSMPTKNGTTLVLSASAFKIIANPAARDINIEFREI